MRSAANVSILCCAMFASFASAQPLVLQPNVQSPSRPDPRPAATGPTGTPVFIDESQLARDLAREAARLADGGRFGEAARSFQQLIEQHPRALMPIDADEQPGVWTDALRWARLRINEDQPLLNAYREHFDGLGEAMLVEAKRATAHGSSALLKVATRYYNCPAGLAAALDYASAELEAGRPHDADALLQAFDDHPDMSAHRGRYLQLRAAAAMFQGDAKTLAVLRSHLTDMKDAALIDQLDAWQQSLHLQPQANRSERQGEPHQPLGAPALLAAKWSSHYWSQNLATLPENKPVAYEYLPDAWARAPNGAIIPRWTRPPIYLTDALTTVPVLAGGKLLMNDGFAIRAFDAVSGEQQWYDRCDTLRTRGMAIGDFRKQWGWHINDPRGIAVHKGHTFAITGRLLGYAYGDNDFFHGSYLMCHDADSGELQWDVRPGELGFKHPEAAFHGTPIVHNGRVYALLHRFFEGVFQETHLLALDEMDGRLLWSRNLVRAHEKIFDTIPSHATMILYEGALYVTDGLGVACRVDAVSGAMRWLTTLQDAKDEKGDQPGHHPPVFDRRIGPPIIIKAGLIVPLRHADASFALIDPDSGAVRQWLAGDEWRGQDRLLRASDHLLQVNTSVTLRDGRTLKQLWQLDLPDAAANSGADDITLLGDTAIISIAGTLHEIDLRTATYRGHKSIGDRAIVTTDGEQIILATARELRVHSLRRE